MVQIQTMADSLSPRDQSTSTLGHLYCGPTCPKREEKKTGSSVSVLWPAHQRTGPVAADKQPILGISETTIQFADAGWAQNERVHVPAGHTWPPTCVPPRRTLRGSCRRRTHRGTRPRTRRLRRWCPRCARSRSGLPGTRGARPGWHRRRRSLGRRLG